MAQMKPVFLILRAELLSITEPEYTNNIVIPWGLEKAPEFFKFAINPSHDDPEYPAQGVSKISRENKDIFPFVEKDEDWKALQLFIDEFKKCAERPKAQYLLSLQTNKNPHRVGASIAQKYLKKLFGRAKTNTVVDNLLRQIHAAPYQMYARWNVEWPSPKKNSAGKRVGSLKPSPKVALSMYGIELMQELFGVTDILEPLPLMVAKALIYSSWTRQLGRARNSMEKVKKLREEKEIAAAAVRASEGKTTMERAELVKAWGKALAAFRKAFEWQSTDEQVDEMLAEQEMIKGLISSAKLGTATNSKLKGLERIFSGMSDPDIIAKMEDDYAEIFSELEEDAEDDADADLAGYLDRNGDLGVDGFRTKNTDHLRELLGLKRANSLVFPFFNAWVSDVGKLPIDIEGFDTIKWDDDNTATTHNAKLRPLRPQWHQYVGLAAMVAQFTKGQNVLLADGVGVGKTLQVFMVAAYMRHIRLAEQDGVRPPLIAQSKNRWGLNPKADGAPTGHILIAVPGLLMKQWEEEAHRFLDRRAWNVLVYPTVKDLVSGFWDKWDKDVEAPNQRDQTTILIISFSTLRRESKMRLSSTRKINLVDQQTGPNTLLHPTRYLVGV